MKSASQQGFTLIELLVVLSIIGFIASIALVSLNSARIKGRDSVRRQQLVQLQKALELYAQDNGSYPPSAGNAFVSSEPNDCNGCLPSDPTNYIPGLVPNYIAKLPADPSGGVSTISVCTPGGWKRSFIYISNGTDYKLMSHCGPETPISAADQLADPVRDSGPTLFPDGCDGSGDGAFVWAWAVYSPGFRCR